MVTTVIAVLVAIVLAVAITWPCAEKRCWK